MSGSEQTIAVALAALAAAEIKEMACAKEYAQARNAYDASTAEREERDRDLQAAIKDAKQSLLPSCQLESGRCQCGWPATACLGWPKK